jgi:GINS complex subunit 2
MHSSPTDPWFQDEEFLADDFLVSVQPNFNTGEPLRMITSEYGPFDRRTTLSIPLWMAIYLERHGKCTIIPPAWLRIDNLKARIREEREKGASMFADMDDMILQVGTVLLNREYLNVDYLGGPVERNAMSALLLELMLIRKSKAVDGMKQIDVTSSVIDITKMTSLERTSIRPQASRMVDQLRDLWLVRETVLGAESRGM